MQYQFSPFLLLRKPAGAHYTHDLQPFLNDPHFCAAMRLASPQFFTVLEKQGFLATNLDQKEKHTLQKYINRFCFRPTPFGLFASVSSIYWGASTITAEAPNYQVFIRTAMPAQHAITDHLIKSNALTDETFRANPFIYRVLNEYRFIRSDLNESARLRTFQLQSIAFSKVLKDLIAASGVGLTKYAVAKLIERSANCGHEEALDYADFLIDAQLLLSEFRMTIAGPDHLQSLLKLMAPGKAQQQFDKLLTAQNRRDHQLRPATITYLDNKHRSVFPHAALPTELSSVILVQTIRETLADSHQDLLRQGIAALECLSTIAIPANVTRFIDRFQQHFEGQSIPLLQALDPEAGIGYQAPDREKNNILLETVNIGAQVRETAANPWSEIHAVLLAAWLRAAPGSRVIRLTDADLKELRPKKEEPMLGMSVLFRIVDQKLFIENAGGINAPALLGRFTVADEGIADAAKKMAEHLEALNPEIIFAEILQLSDPHIDNINRRVNLYHYEIPLTAKSVLPAELQIELSDLFVRVIDRQVILYSEKYQKVVIPRLTSAYNHHLDQLPLFRFLADLSYQYGRSNLGLSLRDLFPGQGFYPRVESGQCILAPATWVLNGEQLKAFESAAGTIDFNHLADSISLPRVFSLSEGDQELTFDRQNPHDVRFFRQMIQHRSEVVLKEFNPHQEVRQYNAFLLPSEPLSMPVIQLPPKLESKRKLIPGSDWLYLKIYVPRTSVNRLLMRLTPLLHRKHGHYRVRQWFFVRYDDHAPHIRLRLQIDPAAISEVLLALKGKLEDRIQHHLIREFQVDVYDRELERYAAGGIENTERFFWASSELVMAYLRNGQSNADFGTPVFALYSAKEIVSLFITEPDAQLAFLKESYQLLLTEFSGADVKYSLDKKFRELGHSIRAGMQFSDPTMQSGSVKSGKRFRQSLEMIRDTLGDQIDLDYLRSIIHLHFNRIFTDEPRKQEMICYYLLFKYLASEYARAKTK